MGMGPLTGLGAGRSRFLHATHCLNIFDLAVSASSGTNCVLRFVAKYLKVLGVKRVGGLKVQVFQSVSTSSGYIP